VLANADGNPWTVGALGHRVKYWMARARLDSRLRFYDLRGTAATRLIEAGLPIADIARHMGWSIGGAAQMLERYAHLDREMTDRVLVRLEGERQ